MPKHTMSMAAVIGALKSPKTPQRLKQGLMRKYGHLLQGTKLSMHALAATVRSNPHNAKYSKHWAALTSHNQRELLHTIRSLQKEGLSDMLIINSMSRAGIDKGFAVWIVDEVHLGEIK